MTACFRHRVDVLAAALTHPYSCSVKSSDVLILAEMREWCRTGRARELRELATVTLAEIGEVCGVSRQAVALWETGQRKPTGTPALEYGKLLRQLAKRAA